MCTAVCSRHSVRGLIAVIASVTPVCLKDTKFPRQQRPVAFWESDPQDSLFLPVPSWVFFVASPTTHSRGNNKSTPDNGAPKQRSWNAVTTGQPLALFTLPSLRPA